jgi:site-specific DNA-methyltransferase (adenine-specific)
MALGLPSEATIDTEEFLEATLDVWEIGSESARKIGHPAPFPIALPRRLIELYTYRSDLVLDPFVGSGTTAVAAIETGRHYVGFDTDDSYLAIARERIAAVTR